MVTITIVVAISPIIIIKTGIILDKNAGDTYYPSALNPLFSRLSKNIIKIGKSTISRVVGNVSNSAERLLHSLCPSAETHETTREKLN
jgi:hypothetical protein